MFTIQIFFQFGEAVIERCNIVLKFMLERLRCIRCTAGCLTDSKVDAAVSQMVDQLELLSDMKWIVMRQHDAACADMHFGSMRGKMRDEHFWCRADQCFQVVVFRNEKPLVA